MAIPDPIYLSERVSQENAGEEMYSLATELFPICRSITGDGVRQTLNIIREKHIPLRIHEVPTGTRVFDWEIPKEWNIRDAWIKNAHGEKIVDFKSSNLHVVNYSTPVNRTVTLEELRRHLHTLPDYPDAIPYRTSYYNETWGFCLSHSQMAGLREENYEVYIDSTLEHGSLTYAEYVHQGESDDEVLVTTHICHPSLANDNLSGIAVLTQLAKCLRDIPTRHTYRFLWIPGTIGSITWLAMNRSVVDRVRHGLVLSCVGDSGGPRYKRSRKGNAEIDRVVEHVLRTTFDQAAVEDFSPYGYDERQFCSPGFDLPVGLFQRSKHGRFPQYHTSKDDLEFIKPVHLGESLQAIARIVDVLEKNSVYRSTNPHCEPQLGRRGLYEAIGGDKERAARQMALLWILNLSDGDHSLLDIAERAQLPFHQISRIATVLEGKGLLEQSR